ncbi:hypothetical protein ACFONC_05445 [Luteimonas soli]|uniref:Uncharacterized protein n=1 Tax=Luteimonas soli TaxID=1648966 RepID=A0ABV7XHE0_9GAMM
MAKPGELLTEVPDAHGNERIYLVLPDERKLPLPFFYRAEEFALPGNMEIHDGGEMFALYDELTRTGAIYSGESWTMWQPVTRAQFFGEQVPSWRTMASLRAGLFGEQ